MIADEVRLGGAKAELLSTAAAQRATLHELITTFTMTRQVALSSAEQAVLLDALREAVLRIEKPSEPRPYFYDIAFDSFRAVTQIDWDQLRGLVDRFGRVVLPHWQPPANWDPEPLPGKLKVFANPMKDGSFFVAEDRPVEPKDGIYPATPKGAYCFPFQLGRSLAEELVARWNVAEIRQGAATGPGKGHDLVNATSQHRD